VSNYDQRRIEETHAHWRRTDSPQRVLSTWPEAQRTPLADWQSRMLGGEPCRVVGALAFPDQQNASLSRTFDALIRWRQGGVISEERFPWPCQGWARQYVCDEVQVFAVRSPDGEYEVEEAWTLGASVNEGVLQEQVIPAFVYVATANVFVPVRPPIATVELRLQASSYDGFVGFAFDAGGLPGSTQNPGQPTLYDSAAEFAEWRAWDGRFGLVAYTISSLFNTIGSPVNVTWQFKVR
jgi:hypothetical protein